MAKQQPKVKLNKNSLTRKKLGPSLGFRTSDFFKASKFSGSGKGVNFGKNPATSFHTQHKGGG